MWLDNICNAYFKEHQEELSQVNNYANFLADE